MVRNLAMLIGAAFVAVLGWALIGSISGVITDPPAATAAEEFFLHPKEVSFSSDGVFGTYDKRQLQRGLQVYKEVCSNCHSLSHVTFHDLGDLGYSDGQVKKFAADWGVKHPELDPKTGTWGERPNLPSDKFPTVYYPGQGNPPDLSLITKARHDGPAYVYSLLTGYAEQPAALLKKFPDAKSPDGTYYNPYFANLNIAMPPPLTSDGQITYLDGTKSTVQQNAKDIAAFLTWAAEPKLEARHTAGFASVIFLLIFCFLAWGAYQNVWRDKEH
ncbi:MAG: cytochrome c1 [Sphingomonas sp.]|jgi:ubiquinol-cytochrome c reductase cytochrome c1 subunit|uniref:cytochrome c1 n=1 Tax=Sphingomonas sp. TaxID=28214 RepID=UPI0035665690